MMSRKSRHTSQLKQIEKFTDTEPETIATANRTAIYARLSLCDSLYHPKEDSIQAQLTVLRDYTAHHPDLTLTAEYIDRGWSGVDFQRPGFLQMIEDIQFGKINCIVVKDLSRFGRNYWETGYFLEVLLPHLKTRFISITDGFDSLTSDPGALAVILKNIINDFFSRELSRRYSDSYDLKKAQGAFNRGQPYGYLYDPEHPGRLTFDPDLYHYVCLIFSWALEGTPRYTIARRLTEMNVPTKEQVTILRHKDMPRRKGGNRWYAKTVVDMLRDRTYAGDFVCGKSYNRKCDPYHVRLNIPEEEWVIIPDTHLAYITREQYDFIRKQLLAASNEHKKRIKANNPKREDYPNLYKGKLICSRCGRKMVLSTCFTQAYENKMHYHCFYEGSKNKEGHPQFTINKRTLDIIVLHQIQEQCRLSKILSSWLRSPEGKKACNRRIEEFQSSLRESSERLRNLKKERATLFELQADALIDQETYKVKMTMQKEEIRQITVELEEAEKNLTEMKKTLSAENPWLRLFSKLTFPQEMSQDLIETTIAHIDVFSPDDAQTVFLHQEWFTNLWSIYQEAHHEDRH